MTAISIARSRRSRAGRVRPQSAPKLAGYLRKRWTPPAASRCRRSTRSARGFSISFRSRRTLLRGFPCWRSLHSAICSSAFASKSSAKPLRTGIHRSDARTQSYLSVFLTAKGEPRNRVVTRTFANSHGELAARLQIEQSRVVGLAQRRRAVLARDRSAAALTFADAVVRRYRRAKDTRGLLDYADLIEKSVALLQNVEAAWVHYKLDLGIDHVLIDEAQDTSPRQWEIVRKLTSEFTAGEGARCISRSIFAVGDEKQSIFSFQGAAPEKFAEMARHFAVRHRD